MEGEGNSGELMLMYLNYCIQGIDTLCMQGRLLHFFKHMPLYQYYSYLYVAYVAGKVRML